MTNYDNDLGSVVCHFQELGIHISCTLSLLVEHKLVVAAISTDNYDRVWVSPKGTDAPCPSWDLELGETPRRAEVLG